MHRKATAEQPWLFLYKVFVIILKISSADVAIVTRETTVAMEKTMMITAKDLTAAFVERRLNVR